MSLRRATSVLASVLLLTACSTAPPTSEAPPTTTRSQIQDQHANEIVMYSMSLLDTGYQFGGRNPEAGLDCSGMVSLVVEKVMGRRLPHNAQQIAGLTREIPRAELKPADLVFFNTNGKPYSHMGIYLGRGKFVHAPSSKGRVRIESMDSSYFATRFTGARSLF